MLSAVEGLKLVTPAFEHYVLPITVAIIFALFMVQSRGTSKVAAFFGPIMVVWFLALGLAALPHIVSRPEVFQAFNPWYALHYLLGHGTGALVALGAVFLAVTGAEALFADLGHFGRRPIQVAWLGLVAPCLTLNYLGQTALVLNAPDTTDPVLPARARMGSSAHGDPGDHRHRHREPGRHHRRVLAVAPGDPARAAAAPRNPPHVGIAFGPDLPAAGEHSAADRRGGAGRAVPLLLGAGPPPTASP